MLDVVVVGAGMAGLSATRRLADAGFQVQCLEARARVGGRAHSFTLPNGARIDRGCAWLHSADINPLVGVAEGLGFKVERYEGSWSEPFTRKLVGAARYEEWAKVRDAVWEAYPAAKDWAEDRPLTAHFPDDSAWLSHWSAIISYIWGTSPEQLSGKGNALDLDTGINSRTALGYGSVVARYGQGLPVATDAPVSRIALTKDAVRVDSAKGSLEARSVVLAVPVSLLQAEVIAFEPGLPERKLWALEGLPLGSNNKVHLAVTGKTPWPKQDFFASFRVDRVAVGQYQFHSFGQSLVEGYFGGDLSRDMAKAGPAEFGAFAKEEIAAHYGNDAKRCLSFLHATAWDLDPWTLGGYSYPKVGYAEARSALAEPLEGRLFFAGEATHVQHAATCHGAYLSGQRAAEEAMDVLKA
ncbi:MAG: NAD(P)/FAD-dependent oxidoreductase [Kiloniellales bacterium]